MDSNDTINTITETDINFNETSPTDYNILN